MSENKLDIEEYFIKPDLNFEKEEFQFLLYLKEDKNSGVRDCSKMLLATRGGTEGIDFIVQFACSLAFGKEMLFLVPQKKVKSLIFDVESHAGSHITKRIKIMSEYLSNKYKYKQCEILSYLKDNVLIANKLFKNMLKECFVQTDYDVLLDYKKINEIIKVCKKYNINLIIINSVMHLLNAEDYGRTYLLFCSEFNEAEINVLTLSYLTNNIVTEEEFEDIYGGMEFINYNRFILSLDYDNSSECYYLKILKGNEINYLYQNKKYMCEYHPNFRHVFVETKCRN